MKAERKESMRCGGYRRIRGKTFRQRELLRRSVNYRESVREIGKKPHLL